MQNTESFDRRVILASRSPRRYDLLSGAIGRDVIEVLPPASSSEAGFEGLHQSDRINQRLTEIVRAKHADVASQLRARTDTQVVESSWIVAADTVVIATEVRRQLVVLGQPTMPNWQPEVARWLREYLGGRSHEVRTAVIVSRGQIWKEFIVTTQVEFDDLSEAAISAYLATDESIGKAGGYAIQGHAAAFVRSVKGSLSNVVGLPIREVVAALSELGFRV